MALSDDEIRSIVARAEELQHAGDLPSREAEALVSAGEQLGISRRAMEQALFERMASRFRPVVGDLVFARSADEKFYPATVLAAGEHGYRVRFLRGGEHSVATDAVRACPFLPGDRVTCAWPGFGNWTCTVVSYDAENATITVNDGWGQTATFPIREVWLVPPSAERQRRRRIYAALLAGGAAVGAALGALITALIL